MNLPEGINIKYGIFTTDSEFANYIVDDYVKHHTCPVIKRVKSAYENYAVMKNGTKYEWINPNGCARGHKCSAGVIDLATCDIDFIRKWIPAICIFAEKKDYVFKDSKNIVNDESYDLRTLIDRLQKMEALLGNVNKLGYFDLEYGWQDLTYINTDIGKIIFGTNYF